MKRTSINCPACGEKVSKSNLSRHKNSKKCIKNQKNTPVLEIDEKWKNEENGMYACPYCEKEFSRNGICSHIWRTHGDGINFTPTPKGTKTAWNKGLTKDSDERVAFYGKSIAKSFSKHPPFGKRKHSKETILKMKNNPNCGGYRKGSGRGKSGWYKGFYCDSSWELAFVIYNLEHGISFKRNTEKFEYQFNGEVKNYIPDFIMEDGSFLEIKGYKTEQWEEKLKQFPQKINVLYKDDMKKYFDYVQEKYGKDFIKLYEK